MDAREKEKQMLERCVAAAKGQSLPRDVEDASVFIVASQLVSGTYPAEASMLKSCALSYLASSSEVALECDELIRAKLIVGLPRFRNMFERALKEGNHGV